MTLVFIVAVWCMVEGHWGKALLLWMVLLGGKVCG